MLHSLVVRHRRRRQQLLQDVVVSIVVRHRRRRRHRRRLRAQPQGHLVLLVVLPSPSHGRRWAWQQVSCQDLP